MASKLPPYVFLVELLFYGSIFDEIWRIFDGKKGFRFSGF